MLKELRKFDNLGTPNYFYQLLNAVVDSNDTNWTTKDLQQLFFNKVVDGRSVFDGCLFLAFKINLLLLNNEKVEVNSRIVNSLNSQKQFSDKFNEFLFHYLIDDDVVYEIFRSEHLSYDIIFKSTQINNSAFGFKHSSFKQLLIDFEIILNHPTPEINSYILNQRYKKLFDKTILPEIKKRKIGIDEFNKQMQQQQIYGEEAEKFVVSYENKRLNERKKIDWLAEYIVNAGYDLLSYDDESDEEYNRFIEVKSFDGEIPYFFWSRNEYQVARLKKDEYWLYLVNRSRISDNDYAPIMIQNPYVNILNNDKWNKQIDKYRIEYII
ncbi:MAG: DUF3883 domain-containing protein [Flavobacterium sp.]|nr:DUF3883 domain-containing protein [Flavobacterium sp.]